MGIINLWPKTRRCLVQAHWHVYCIHSQPGLTYRCWWRQRPSTAPITSRCRAPRPVGGPDLRSAGWSPAFLRPMTLLLWKWVKVFTQTAPTQWAASCASPPTCRMRTAWLVWSITKPCRNQNSPRPGWKPTVSSRSPPSVSVLLEGDTLSAAFSSLSFAIMHHDSASHNTIRFLCWFFTLAIASHSAPHTQRQTINHTMHFINVGMLSLTDVKHMEHHNAAICQWVINTISVHFDEYISLVKFDFFSHKLLMCE